MEYKMMMPPFEHVDFIDMKKHEAQQYFTWYTSQVQNRIDYLREVLQKDGIEDIGYGEYRLCINCSYLFYI